MGCACGGGTKKETMNQTTTPIIPDWWQKRYNSTDSALGQTGMTGDQQFGLDFLKNRLGHNLGSGAYWDWNNASQYGRSEMHDQYNAANNVPGMYWDQYNKTTARTLPGDVSAGDSGTVQANSGADYMGNYSTALNNDYVNASLADYDAGVGKAFNGFRAQNAGAFGNKRLGVAESNFFDDATRGRATLSSGLRKDAFNTAAGLGQTDADRYYGASGQNASLGNQMKQFNAGLQDSRQRFDAQQQNVADSRLLDILSGTGGAIANAANISQAGTNLVGQGVGYGNQTDATEQNNANSIGQYGGMGVDQLIKLLGVGTAGIGQNMTGTGTSSGGGNLFGALSGLALGAGQLGWKPFGK